MHQATSNPQSTAPSIAGNLLNRGSSDGAKAGPAYSKLHSTAAQLVCCSSARIQISQGGIDERWRVPALHACGVNITVANGCLSSLGRQVKSEAIC